MTNRDPFRPDFLRRYEELYQCVSNYFVLKNSEQQLLEDLTKPDINLVCNYEVFQLKKHMRQNPWGLFKQDFDKLTPEQEQALTRKLNEAYGN